jgi:hypothetical protein
MRDDDTYSKQQLAYSINGFAKKGPFSRSSIYAAIRTGKLKAKRLGCRMIITDEAAREYLDSMPDVPATRVG